MVAGPTGIGKTNVAIAVASLTDADIISADSRQVYSWFDIGTDKPTRKVRRDVRFHMVDRVAPNMRYSAADYARDATAVMRRLTREGRRFIVVGGSGLYIRALFDPLFDVPKPDPVLRTKLEARPSAELYQRLRTVDPERADRLSPNDRQRIVRALEIYELTGHTPTELVAAEVSSPEFEPVYVVLTLRLESLYERIDRRFDRMMADGLLEEVQQMRDAGFSASTPAMNAYGYTEILRHLDGALELNQAVELAKAKSRAYARRQLTWFRALKGARWIENNNPDDTVIELTGILASILEAAPKPPGPHEDA